MKKIITGLILIIAVFSCREKKLVVNTAELKTVIFETDRAFSKMSEVKGLRNAYMEFIDSNGVLLRPNNYPIESGDAINFISQSNDEDFVMTWEPRSATVSASGDLAYSYGIYSYKAKTADSVYLGSYVTIWRKQLDGTWKFILQTGNEGLE